MTDQNAPLRLPAGMAKRTGPRRTWYATAIDAAMITVLTAMIIGGLVMIAWAASSFLAVRADPAMGIAKADPATILQIGLQVKGFAANLLLTGITTIYCGITGFILMENRRMRMQAIMPHVQVLSPVRSTDAITMEVQNAGAAPAVNVHVKAWVMKRVPGNSRTPDSALFRGYRPALPATQNPSRMQLQVVSESESDDFNLWRDHYRQASATPDSLDVHVLLLNLTYDAVDGTTMTECLALPLSEQPTLPGGAS